MSATHTIIDSPVGELTLVARGGVLSGLYFPGHWYMPDADVFGVRCEGFEKAERQLAEYFAGERTDFDLETTTAGDEFQRGVWELIERIPYGQTTTYGEIARELGDEPTLARKVGGAVGRNPLSVIVPCHRVVGKDGKLTGYAGGLERKRFLLELEGPDGAAEDDPRLF